MTDKTKQLGLSTDEKISLSASEQRFRAAEIAGDTVLMQIEFASENASALRRQRDNLDADERIKAAVAQFEEKAGKLDSEKKRVSFIQSFTNFIYGQVLHVRNEIVLYRRLSDRRLKNLEDKIAAFEANDGATTLRYRGVWKQGMQAKMGDFLTHNGALWACLCDTDSKPGTDRNCWQLAAKGNRT